jgi:membrane-bound metal-dependent hydrolase YbcI (DUF457 family)
MLIAHIKGGMFVGHALGAFAAVAGGARLFGCSRRRSLALGTSAGAFAAAPDVDILYAPVGLASASGVADAAESFWSAGNLVHRTVTHSLVIGTVVAVALWLWGRARREDTTEDSRSLLGVEHGGSLLALGGLVVVAGVVSGPLGALVMAAFALSSLAIAELAARYGDLGPRAVFLTALIGFVSHPFGDLLTGEPPRLLYPFDVRLVSERLALAADPTLHLLGAFWLELLTIWLAAVVYCELTDRNLTSHIHGRATLGVAYAAVALALPAPTVDSSYRFVLSVLAVGTVGPAPLVRHARRPRHALDGEGVLTAALTGLAAVTLASLAYAAVYLAL